MSLLDGADVFLLTGEIENDHIAARLDRAERLLCSELRRASLASDDYAETLRLCEDVDGDALAVVYPTHTPVTAVATAGVSVRDTATLAVDEWPADDVLEIDVDYTAGWTAVTLPEDLRAAVAEVAVAMGAPRADVPAVPAGVSSVRQGDAAVTVAPAGGVSLVRRVVPSEVLTRWRAGR